MIIQFYCSKEINFIFTTQCYVKCKSFHAYLKPATWKDYKRSCYSFVLMNERSINLLLSQALTLKSGNFQMGLWLDFFQVNN